MKKVIMGVIMVLLAVTVTTGQAQVKAGSVSVTPYIGGYVFEGNEDLKNAPAFGLRGGYSFTKSLGIEGFFNYVPSEMENQPGNPNVKLYGFGVEGLYHFMPDSRLVPFVAVGLGGTRYSPSGDFKNRDRFTVDYGAGLKYFLTESLALRADVRHVILPLHDNYNELLYSVGLTFAFGGEKKAEPVVQQVRAAAPAAAPVAAPRDSDGDGVTDDLDKCPGTPAGVAVDRDGCPFDTDGDGVYDYLDKCPGTPAGVVVNRDGCPLDSDGDGVPDYLDKCPGTPAGVKVDKDGCPPPLVQKAAPRPASAVEKAITEKGRVTLNVEFDFNKATIRKGEQADIAQLAEVMKKYPDLQILIEGHTDNVGNAKYNEKLSLQRANAVKKSLVDQHGIAASRLDTKGFGMTKPVASNKTKEGRQKNRRVEASAEYIVKK